MVCFLPFDGFLTLFTFFRMGGYHTLQSLSPDHQGQPKVAA